MDLFLEQLAKFLFTLLGLVLSASVAYLTPKIKRQIAVWVDKDNLGILEGIVEQAVEMMEKEISGSSGEEKFEQASEYASLMAERYGMDFSPEFIRGAVQKGWRKLDERQTKEGDK